MAERQDLRTENAAAAKARTRQRILDGLARAVGAGSFPPIPAIARMAHVSVQTIYRHFENREGLLAALPDFVDGQFDLDRVPADYTFDEVVTRLSRLYRTERPSDNGLVALFSTDVGLPIWREQYALARDGVLNALQERFPDDDPEKRGRLADMIMVLLALSSVQVLREVLGRSGEEADATVQWALEALIAARDQLPPARDVPPAARRSR